MASENESPAKSPIVKSEIHLDVHRGDKPVNASLLSQFGLFRRMKKAIPVEKLPGSIVLRSYRSGNVVFRQGQAGGTAFYVPTAEDLVRLKSLDEGKAPPADPVVDPGRNRQILSALIIPATMQPKAKGFFERWFSPAVKRDAPRVTAIPGDVPTDIDYLTREAPLMEGDLFGEMSCISFMPRSATVVARVDCQLLEFNRNVFDQLRGDPNHQASVEVEYRRRTLDTHLRQFELFRDLSEAQIQTLKESVSLEVVPPGKVICEEGEPWSDTRPLDVFIVRSGVVQVTVNASLSLHKDDIRDWTGLCRQLAASTPHPQGAGPPASSAATAAMRVAAPVSKVLVDKARGPAPANPVEPAAPAANAINESPAREVEAQPATAGPVVKKPSAQDMLAAMRAKKAASTSAEPSTPGLAQPITILAPASPPADTAAPPDTPTAKKPSAQDMLAAMRAKKAGAAAEGQTPPASAAVVKPPADESPPPINSSLMPETAIGALEDLPLLKESRSKDSGPPAYVVHAWLSDPVQELVRRCAHGEPVTDPIKSVILNALNALAGSRRFLQEQEMAEFLQHPEILRKSASFPKGLKGIGKDWSELELRTTGRAVLSAIFPEIIRKPIESAGPPRVLAYLSRGDCIGEIAVVNGSPRSATCIAYNHPSSESARDFGDVELVRIPGSAFRRLMAESAQLQQQVASLAAARISQLHAAESGHTESELVASPEFQQMGLFQGTKLLVIDLDSCTRCGDCVKACVDTHDDGYSRLFLDGPRYDRFLVPSACRNCLNPVCMIGCPVGSIGRGANGQIEIYDWCIGCSACADQCPYDSIQMHDTGLIPEESMAWVCASRRSLPDDWHQARRLGAGWMQGTSPFRWQGDFLRYWSTEQHDPADTGPLRLCFRHEFRLPKKSNSRHFRLSIHDDRRKGAIEKMRVKKSTVAGVWLNGKQIEWSGNSVDLDTAQFTPANNLLAIEVILDRPAEYGQFVLSATLDAIPEAGSQTLEVLGKEVRPEMDLVTRRAAVCDLCSHLPGQQPACVTSCPHDAAMRINPLVSFPH